MSTSENALPKLVRAHLEKEGFQFSRVKTTPNFTYNISREVKTATDAEFDQAEAIKDYTGSLAAALGSMEGINWKVLSEGVDEGTPPQDEDVRVYLLTARVKATGYKAAEVANSEVAEGTAETAAPAPKAKTGKSKAKAAKAAPGEVPETNSTEVADAQVPEEETAPTF